MRDVEVREGSVKHLANYALVFKAFPCLFLFKLWAENPHDTGVEVS